MRALLIATSLIAVASCQKPAPEAQNEAEPAAEAGPVKGLDTSHKGKPAPGTVFNDPDGGDISLADFRGTPVLVNMWATWCAPCVKELPTLDKLAASHRVDGQLGVIAVSQDFGPQPSVTAFLDKLNIKDLGAYHDPKGALMTAAGAEVLPTTILFDAEGKEVWRYVGDLNWTSAEAAKLLEQAGPSKAR